MSARTGARYPRNWRAVCHACKHRYQPNSAQKPDCCAKPDIHVHNIDEPCALCMPCGGDRGCQREAGHEGMHMSRTWDSDNCMEIIDEWGNVDLEALAKEKP